MAALLADMDDSQFPMVELANAELPDVRPHRKPKPAKPQDVPAQLKDLRSKTSAELGAMSSLHRVLRCLPYAKDWLI